MAELLPCPFCGGKAELEGLNNGNPFIVYCTQCGVEMGNEKDFYSYQAIEAWNTRTPKERGVEVLVESYDIGRYDHYSDTFIKKEVGRSEKGTV